MKVRKLIAALGASILGLLAALWFGPLITSDAGKSNTDGQLNQSADVSAQFSGEKRTDNGGEKKRTADIAKFNSALGTSLKSAQDNVATELSPQQELARQSIIGKTVAPHFMEKAPFALEKLFQRQPVDEEWTRQTVEVVGQILEKQTPGVVSMLKFQCHQTICQGEFSSDDRASLENVVHEIYDAPEIEGGAHGFTTDNEDGTFESSVFLTRAEADREIQHQMLDTIFEEITGTPANSVIPTDEQVKMAVAEHERILSLQSENN
jgi:hypothetical protein